jgi:hypothetical protein
MKIIVYVECGSIDDIDNALGQAVDDRTVQKYAVLTVDGAPILYYESGDSDSEYLNSMGMSCCGLTEGGV